MYSCRLKNTIVIRTLFLLILSNIFLCSSQIFPKPIRIPVWPDEKDIPGILPHNKSERFGIYDGGWMSRVHVPSLVYYAPSPERRSKAAVIILPGGAYLRISHQKEGIVTAVWLGHYGIHAFVLNYRHYPYKYPYPLMDLLQSITYLRSNAEKYGINPNFIGVLGFSAGGHLAACSGTLFAEVDKFLVKGSSSLSIGKPDFMGLIYPVITMQTEYTHSFTREHLLGRTPKPEDIELLSVEKNIKQNSPPAFLVHTSADHTVSVQNSVLMYEAMVKQGLSAELHLFEKGRHGFGSTHNSSWPVTMEWPRLFQAWLFHKLSELIN